MNRRRALAMFVASAALFATAACTSDPDDRKADGKPATEILAQAAATSKDQSFAYVLNYGPALSVKGSSEAAANKALINAAYVDPTSAIKVTIDGLIVGGTVLVKINFGALAEIPGLGGLGEKWMRVDVDQAPRLATFGLKPGENLFAAGNIVKAVVSAQRTGDTTFSGTLDLAKASLPAVGPDDIATVADKDRVVGFTATLDGAGRISRIVVAVPRIGAFPAGDLSIAYSDYGRPVTVSEPAAAQIVDAPALLYTLL